MTELVWTCTGLDVGAYVCGGDEPDIVTINEQISDIAIAVAEAFAEVSANCFAEGNAMIRAQGYAFAEERAEALGTAVSVIFASAEVCGECDAAIGALSAVTEELFVEAIATAWHEVCCCQCHNHTSFRVRSTLRKRRPDCDRQH